ncbi:hypothetical protein ACFOD1_04730 [Pseudidiomarina halophila]|uniref:Uncharacterized protein n=1 Tax=Pseudidiomarina halophila TaxID=1449799 RepID=A0A432XZW7_9GAMM|nr:hypothetical protein [Pseudidiomarina halophila]RUO54234.1 hypothetical protein CWI69_02080 [Pseudidiomarina halophila]
MKARILFPLLFILVVLTSLLSGCASTPKSSKHHQGKIKHDLFPPYADRSLDIHVQEALMRRGLIQDVRGEVLPASKHSCPIYTYWEPESFTSDYMKENFIPLYDGIHLTIVERRDELFIESRDGSSLPLTTVTIEKIKSALPKRAFLRFDLQQVRNTKRLASVGASLRAQFVTDVVTLVTAIEVLPRARNVYVDINNVKAIWDDGRVFARNEESISDVLYQTFTTMVERNDYNLSADSISVTGNLLGVCQQLTNFVYAPEQPLTQAVEGNVPLTSVILGLPKNANFNRLNDQRNLIASGKYLRFDGQVVQLADQLAVGKVKTNCETLSPTDPDYRYCQVRHNDEVETNDETVIIRTGNN